MKKICTIITVTVLFTLNMWAQLDEQITTQHSAFNIQNFTSGIYFMKTGNTNNKILIKE